MTGMRGGGEAGGSKGAGTAPLVGKKGDRRGYEGPHGPSATAVRNALRQRKRDDVAVVTAMHQFAAWWFGRVAKFPKDFKFSLGQRSIDGVLDLLELLVEAAYLPSAERAEALASANRRIERLRHLVRLAHATAALPHEAYGHAAEQLDAIGKQVGGWLRHALLTEATDTNA